VSGRWRSATVGAFVAATVVLVSGPNAGAAVVSTVPLGTSQGYSVLGASTVTNTGPSTLAGSLGLSPGTAVTGFPPGLVSAPGTIDATTAAAQQAQSAASNAYDNAAGRSVDATTTADLANLTLKPGVYSGTAKSSLLLSGPLTLDAQGDTNAVFIFQTDSTLTTMSGSAVTLINGAQQCNVFWQIGSSATLGTGSVFAGTILARTSITVNDSVTVHGRAFALTGAVTLQNDTFRLPTCARSAAAGSGVVGSGVVGSGGTIPATGGGLAGRLPWLAGLALAAGTLTMVVARRRPGAQQHS
jgi:hypothetical protein